jgi:hypothetical protein
MKTTVIDATTCETVLAGVSSDYFERWYDHHCEWRKPRGLEEVHPALRRPYIDRDDESVQYLVRAG